MRFYIFFVIALILSACNNDISSIGQNLLDDDTYVEVEKFNIPTSTVKIDSFNTSSGFSSSDFSEMVVGKLKDPITGVTTAIPYFEIVPSGSVSLRNTVYDSLTFNIKFSEKIWGDSTTVQTYYIHQLEELPYLYPENDYYIYNNTTLKYNPEPIGQIRILPIYENLRKLISVRVNDSIGRELYDMVRYRNPLVNGDYENDHDFIKFFKGLTLIPADGNNSLMPFQLSKNDSLSLKVHYHDINNDYTYVFGKSTTFKRYTFMYVHNDASGTPYAALTNQLENLDFSDAATTSSPLGQTVTQALSGYMIKMRLPVSPAAGPYETILKAEIVLKVRQNSRRNNFTLPDQIQVYSSNRNNRILSEVQNAAGISATGTLDDSSLDERDYNYTINITDYYNSLAQTLQGADDAHILISIPISSLRNSFDKLVVDEVPTLNVYYAKYN